MLVLAFPRNSINNNARPSRRISIRTRTRIGTRASAIASASASASRWISDSPIIVVHNIVVIITNITD